MKQKYQFVNFNEIIKIYLGLNYNNKNQINYVFARFLQLNLTKN